MSDGRGHTRLEAGGKAGWAGADAAARRAPSPGADVAGLGARTGGLDELGMGICGYERHGQHRQQLLRG